MPLMEDILDLALTPSCKLPKTAIEKANLSLLDWMVCGWAGKDEPLAQKLRTLALDEAGSQVATVIGAGKAPARMAALVNGATSHALDYDDTHFAHVGHLSVGIYPAALAVAEEIDASAGAMVEAFLVGAEVTIRIGLALGKEHYNRGFHQTATAGAFGATVASARLYKLDREQIRVALGLCATRASGLKSQFGTMGKPYNAGLAASNGVECAKLAALGFSSSDDGLFDPQGFIPTHTERSNFDSTKLASVSEKFLFEDNKYKFHACCHGTHAMIEGLQDTGQCGEDLGRITNVTLRTNPRWLKVCDNKAPQTGLEVKFSYAWLAGMTIRGDDTRNEQTFTDSLALDEELAKFATCVFVNGDPEVTDLQAEGEVTFKSGQVVPFQHDLDAPMSNLNLKEKLSNKASSAIGEKGSLFLQQLERLHELSATDIGTLLATDAM